MSVKVELLEHNMAKLTIEVAADEFSKAITRAYNKNKKSISLPGFRKGKAPQQLVEKMYGAGVFYEDAANDLINMTYPEEAESTNLEITSRPVFDVVQIEKGKDFIYTAEVALRPEVVLGNYKGIEVKKAEITVADEEIDAEISKEQEKNSRLVVVEDRAAMDGDTIVLDYAGTVDGVAFDGGTAADQTLVLGSGSFIPGFEEQLVGVNAGEEKDVEVTFPADYHAADLAGKAAVFHCAVKKIQKKELPELNDDFAQDISDCDTMAEYRESVKGQITERKTAQAKTAQENEAIDKLIEASEMDIPQAMIDSQAAQMFQQYTQRLQSQGIPVDLFFQYQGTTPEKALEDMKPQALKQIQTRLVLEAVVKAEDIKVSDARVEEELANIAAQYSMEVEKIKEIMGDAEKESLRKDLAVQEAVTFIAENVVEA